MNGKVLLTYCLLISSGVTQNQGAPPRNNRPAPSLQYTKPPLPSHTHIILLRLFSGVTRSLKVEGGHSDIADLFRPNCGPFPQLLVVFFLRYMIAIAKRQSTRVNGGGVRGHGPRGFFFKNRGQMVHFKVSQSLIQRSRNGK